MTRLLGTRSWLIRPRIRHEVILLMLLLLLFGVAAAVKPDLLRWSRQMYASRQLWDTAMVAIAMTMIIITGGIDLSVGSLMGLCAVTFGMLHGITHSVILASLGCLATGLVGGMTNGWLISTTGVHPLLVTRMLRA